MAVLVGARAVLERVVHYRAHHRRVDQKLLRQMRGADPRVVLRVRKRLGVPALRVPFDVVQLHRPFVLHRRLGAVHGDVVDRGQVLALVDHRRALIARVEPAQVVHTHPDVLPTKRDERRLRLHPDAQRLLVQVARVFHLDFAERGHEDDSRPIRRVQHRHRRQIARDRPVCSSYRQHISILGPLDFAHVRRELDRLVRELLPVGGVDKAHAVLPAHRRLFEGRAHFKPCDPPPKQLLLENFLALALLVGAEPDDNPAREPYQHLILCCPPVCDDVTVFGHEL
mmetsp:Transcript_13440/g.31547  ORF Transcript_13440/g.31547 Transcript_13440/m.31547 type:complete len:283 (+) Transcript_13440:2726-3574(+)